MMVFSEHALIMSINVTYLLCDDDTPALGDFDRSGPWICDELVYMLQQQNKYAKKNWIETWS